MIKPGARSMNEHTSSSGPMLTLEMLKQIIAENPVQRWMQFRGKVTFCLTAFSGDDACYAMPSPLRAGHGLIVIHPQVLARLVRESRIPERDLAAMAWMLAETRARQHGSKFVDLNGPTT